MPSRRGTPTKLRKILPRPPNAPYVPNISQTGLYHPEMDLETGARSHNGYAPKPSQNRFDLHPLRCQPSVTRHNSQSTSDDDTHYSLVEEDDEDEDYVMSDEEPRAMKQLVTNHQPRKRRHKPAFQSKLSKKVDAVPGEPGHNHGKKGNVRTNVFGGLEYWRKDEKIWIPAVYHHQIREKLIQKANTNNAAVYANPRKRGKDDLDITAFLESQRDWDLERDNGWTGVEFLFEFDRTSFRGPTYKVPWMYDEGRFVLDTDNHPVRDYKDIPLTVSSEIEGGLMEAIRHVDPRIIWGDFWARLPEKCGNGGILEHSALSNRARLFRLKNCIPARKERRGTKELRDFIRGLMSPAVIAANSTRELSKLSDEQQKQAQKLNKGKHDANAGGYRKWLNNARRGGSAPRKARNAVAKKRKPTLSESHKNARRELTFGLDFHENTERRPSSFIPEEDLANELQSPHSSTPSTLYTSPNSFSGKPYGYAPLDPPLHLGFANHGFGPFASSCGTYEDMSIEPAFAAPNSYIPPFDAWEGSSSGTPSTLSAFASSTDLAILPPSGEISYQYIPPQTPEDAQYTPEALVTIQAHIHGRVMNDWPVSTTAYQSNMF